MDADIDVAEAEEAGNATMVGVTDQAITNGNATKIQIMAI